MSQIKQEIVVNWETSFDLHIQVKFLAIRQQKFVWSLKEELFGVRPFSSPEPLGLICNRPVAPLVSQPRDQETTGSGDENGVRPKAVVMSK